MLRGEARRGQGHVDRHPLVLSMARDGKLFKKQSGKSSSAKKTIGKSVKIRSRGLTSLSCYPSDSSDERNRISRCNVVEPKILLKVCTIIIVFCLFSFCSLLAESAFFFLFCFCFISDLVPRVKYSLKFSYPQHSCWTIGCHDRNHPIVICFRNLLNFAPVIGLVM